MWSICAREKMNIFILKKRSRKREIAHFSRGDEFRCRIVIAVSEFIEGRHTQSGENSMMSSSYMHLIICSRSRKSSMSFMATCQISLVLLLLNIETCLILLNYKVESLIWAISDQRRMTWHTVGCRRSWVMSKSVTWCNGDSMCEPFSSCHYTKSC